MYRLSQADVSTSIINKIVENAKKFGVLLPLEFAKESSDRENIISQLLVSIPDSQVAYYFNEFLIVNQVPWTKTRDLMSKALAAPASGGNVQQVLDFALRHYTRKLNFNQTKEIIDSGLKLQNTSRNINVFQVLTDALDNQAPTISFVGLAPDSASDIFTLNKLVAISLNKNEEDTEMLRRDFIKSLDQLQRTREVDDRLKAIAQTLDASVFNRQLSDIVKFCSEVFQISMEDPVIQAFRRVLIQLKLGTEFRTQFLSDFESTITSPRIKDTSPDPGQNDKLIETLRETFGPRASTNSFIKVAQPEPEKQKSVPAGDENGFSNFLRDVIAKLAGFKAGLDGLAQPGNLPIPPDKKNQVSSLIKAAAEKLNGLITALQSLKSNFDQGLLTDPQKIFDEFFKVWDELGKSLEGIFGALPDNLGEFLKVGEDLIESLAKAMGLQPETVKNFLGLMTLSATGLSIAARDIKGVLSSLAILFTADSNLTRIKAAKLLGKEVPKAKDLGINTQELEQAFRNMGATQDQLNTLISLDKYASSVKATIADREQTLIRRMTTEIKTNSGSSFDAPLAGNKEIQREYARFYEYLREANKTMSYYLDMISALVQQFRMDPKNEKLLLAKTGPALQRRATIEATVVEIRNKLSKYKSFSIIADNVQKRNRLIMDLQVIVPEIEKYMATGISIADLFIQPNGLSSKLKEMSDSLIEDRDRLYKEIQKAKESRKPIRFVPYTAPKTPETPFKPEFLGKNKEEAMEIPPAFSTFEDRPK